MSKMEHGGCHCGGCHCGKVKYEVELGEIEQAISCNCSICSLAGWALAFVPATQFKLTTNESALSDYQFGKKSIHHVFCTTCGVRSFGYGDTPDGRMYSVNLRSLRDFDLDKVDINEYDGRAL